MPTERDLEVSGTWSSHDASRLRVGTVRPRRHSRRPHPPPPATSHVHAGARSGPARLRQPPAESRRSGRRCSAAARSLRAQPRRLPRRRGGRGPAERPAVALPDHAPIGRVRRPHGADRCHVGGCGRPTRGGGRGALSEGGDVGRAAGARRPRGDGRRGRPFLGRLPPAAACAAGGAAPGVPTSGAAAGAARQGAGARHRGARRAALRHLPGARGPRRAPGHRELRADGRAARSRAVAAAMGLWPGDLTLLRHGGPEP
eukprot:scaffold99696_cov65-Phaeocystis_antarctica.AAC.3